MLLRAAQPRRLGVGLVVTRAGQRPHVGEHPQQPMLAGEQRRVVVRVADDPLHLARVDVVAEHEPLEARSCSRSGWARRRGTRRTRCARRRPAVARRRAARAPPAAPARRRGRSCRRAPRARARGRARSARSPSSSPRRPPRRRPRRPRRRPRPGSTRRRPGARLRTRPPSSRAIRCGDAVDLDEQVRVLDGGQRAVRAPCTCEAMLVTAEPRDQDLDRLAVDRHAVAVGRDLRRRPGGRTAPGGAARPCARDRRRPAGARGARTRRSVPAPRPSRRPPRRSRPGAARRRRGAPGRSHR